MPNASPCPLENCWLDPRQNTVPFISICGVFFLELVSFPVGRLCHTMPVSHHVLRSCMGPASVENAQQLTATTTDNGKKYQLWN
jgi:hypothetical protein